MWLDVHQGAGLLGFMPKVGMSVLPVLSHPEAAMELEVLWQLSMQWQHQGYPVLVLDATAVESHVAPGLAQWLDAQGCPGSAACRQDVTVLPAANGVQRLLVAGGGRGALDMLESVLHGFAVVVLYASPSAVAALLHGQGVSPLVIAAPGDAGLLRSYTLLKQMAHYDAWTCTVAAVVPPGGEPQATERALQALRQGCVQWLGGSARMTTLNADDVRGMESLALQLLENACTVGLPGVYGSHMARRAAAAYHDNGKH